MTNPVNSILDTSYIRRHKLEKLLPAAIQFLHKNEGIVTYRDDSPKSVINSKQLVSNLTPSDRSPLSEMFKKITATNGLDNILFIDPSSESKNVPEALVMTDVCIDGRFVEPDKYNDGEIYETVWLNMAPMIRRGNPGRFTMDNISDIGKTVSSVVRAYLCYSYNGTSDWLPTDVAQTVIEFYTMTVTATLSRVLQLDNNDELLTQTTLAYFMAELLNCKRGPAGYPAVLKNMRRLYSRFSTQADYEKTLKDLATHTPKDRSAINLDWVVHVLKNVGNGRLKDLNRGIDIERMFTVSSVDTVSFIISLSYPPYFLHQIMAVLGRYKHPIMSNILKNRMDKRQVERSIMQLVNNKSFYRD